MIGRLLSAGRVTRSRTDSSGQAAIVAVIVLSVVLMAIGATLVQTNVATDPLQQTRSVQVYSARALEAGVNSYLTAINTNAGLAQCSSATNGLGTCSGLTYETWTQVQGTGTSGSDAEYYAFGNPQPSFNSVTGALNYLTVEVAGAAHDVSTANHYVLQTENITVSPVNGFLNHVWWANYETYNPTGDYSNCAYNWANNYDNYYNNSNTTCYPVYFGNDDVVNGPIYTNDSVYIDSSDGAPSFGTTAAGSWPGPSSVQTADPNCLFVTSSLGMDGSSSGCNQVAANNVAACAPVSTTQYVSASTPKNSGSSQCEDDTLLSPGSATSSYANSVEVMPPGDTQLQTLAKQNGCLYAGPTQVTLSSSQMTVVSPDTPANASGDSTLGISGNTNTCPVSAAAGTAPVPSNGVVYAETAPSADDVQWSNPFDDPVSSTLTNVTSSPAPSTSTSHSTTFTLTTTVTGNTTYASPTGTVAFTQTTTSGGRGTTTNVSGCSAQALTTVSSSTSTATCTVTLAARATLPTYGATYSGDSNYTTSSGVYGTTSTGASTTTYGANAQVQSQCNGCYYGQTSANPDLEADVFVNGDISGQLTIGSQNNIIIDGSLTYDDCLWRVKPGSSTASTASESYCNYNTGAGAINDALGLIANNYVEVNQPVTSPTGSLLPSCGSNPGPLCNPGPGGSNGSVTIDAAILAINQSFVVNNYSLGSQEGKLIIYGSIEQYARGPVAILGTSGYSKYYTWDPLLPFVSPPDYLVPTMSSWTLSSTTGDTTNPTYTSCPSLPAPSSSGLPPTTAYCSASGTGLPSYG